MITLRPLGHPRTLEKSGLQLVCCFDVYWKLSGENSKNSLTSCGYSIDFFKKIEDKRTTAAFDDFLFFQSVLMDCSSINLKKNDRISYIDNDNDEIPIDRRSEYLEALKFAQESWKDKKKCVTLIITRVKDKSGKASLKNKKAESSNNSSDKMPPMRVESTPLRDLLTAETPEGAAAVHEFQNFLESYKKQIVAEVTQQVLKKMTSAMLLSQNMDTVENQFPRSSQSFPQKISKKSRKSKKLTGANLQSSGEVLDDHWNFGIHKEIPLDAFGKFFSGLKPHRSQETMKIPAADDVIKDTKEKLMTGISNRCSHHRLEVDKAMKSLNMQQTDGNNLSSEEENAGISGKSGNNYDNQNVNDKPPLIDLDNLYMPSEDSHTSDFMTEDDNYEYNHIIDCDRRHLRLETETEEPFKSEEAEEPRHESPSSFELVSESPSWMDDKEQRFFLEKDPQKPVDYKFIIKPEASNTNPKDNVTSPVFDPPKKEKSYEINIAETSEDIFINPELEKRSGGAYSYVPHNLKESRENVFDVSSLKSTKSEDKKFKMFKVDEEPQVIHFENKAGEQQKSQENREIPQSRRRVVFDHNTSKGLGDTKQTSPKKKGGHKCGESRRRSSFNPGSSFQHHCDYTKPSCYFFPSQFPDERSGTHEPWPYFYGGQVPPQMGQPQWPHGYPPYPDTMHILPETLISGAVQAASSAYTTARKVIEKIRSPPPDSARGPQPPKM